MRSPGEDLHAAFDEGWLLPAPAARTPLHTRSIVCRSFRRDDGLFDIDARFVDTRASAHVSPFRGHCDAGFALHHMQLRVTMDRQRNIVALQSAMPGTPYVGCDGAEPGFQRVVGLSMGRGFRKALRERIGGTAGCTHVLALLEAVAAAAVQAQYADHHAARMASGGRRPIVYRIEEMADSCWSHRRDGPVLAFMRQSNEALAAETSPTDRT